MAPLPLTSASSNSAAAIARSRAARSSLAVSSVSSIPARAPGFEGNVDEVERDDVAQRRMARVVIGNHRLREREPFVPTLCHALRTRDLDDGRAQVRAPYFARCLPKKANTLLQPSIACSGR